MSALDIIQVIFIALVVIGGIGGIIWAIKYEKD